MTGIRDIGERLHSPKWNIRLQAVKELGHGEDKEKAAELLVSGMHDRSKRVRRKAASVLFDLVSDRNNELDLSDSIRGISFFLSGYADRHMKWEAVSILMGAATNGIDISNMVDGLVGCLNDRDSELSYRALRTLGMAATNSRGQDRVISKLIEHCENADFDIEEDVVKALEIAAEKGDRQTREKIVSALNKIVNSDWFREEAEENTDTYLKMIGELGSIMEKLGISVNDGRLSEGTVKPPKRKAEAKKVFARRAVR